MLDPFIAHPQYLSGFGTGRDLQQCFAGERRDGNFGTQCCLRECQFQIHHHIVAVAQKNIVIELFDDNDGITSRTAAPSLMSLPLQCEIISFADTGRYLYLQR